MSISNIDRHLKDISIINKKMERIEIEEKFEIAWKKKEKDGDPQYGFSIKDCLDIIRGNE